jgi:hypothetical protein
MTDDKELNKYLLQTFYIFCLETLIFFNFSRSLGEKIGLKGKGKKPSSKNKKKDLWDSDAESGNSS